MNCFWPSDHFYSCRFCFCKNLGFVNQIWTNTYFNTWLSASLDGNNLPGNSVPFTSFCLLSLAVLLYHTVCWANFYFFKCIQTVNHSGFYWCSLMLLILKVRDFNRLQMIGFLAQQMIKWVEKMTFWKSKQNIIEIRRWDVLTTKQQPTKQSWNPKMQNLCCWFCDL